MFSGPLNKDKVNELIRDVTTIEGKADPESLQTKYNKPQMFGAVQQLADENKELLELQERMNEIGEPRMDEKDLEIWSNKFEKMLDEKLDKRFVMVEDNLENIQNSVAQTCKDGKCFTGTLENLQEKLNDIDGVREAITGIKTDVEIKNNEVKQSITQMDKRFNESISGINDKLEDTCTGVDCIKKRLEEEDDMTECPHCGTVFALSLNTIGDTIVCPNCKKMLKAE